MASPLKAFLNLGCGERFLPTWTNVDFVSRPPDVQAHDLRKRLPFGDGCFSVVYHSHVLEHLVPADSQALLKECNRVLKTGGLLRVVVPDLETKALLYLEKLRSASEANDARSSDEHQWMILEIIDQMVRTRSGGEMLEFMRSGRASDFVQRRIGDEYARARAFPAPTPSGISPRLGVRTRLRGRIRSWLQALLGLDDSDLKEVEFRRLGELHRWMYDRVTLARELRNAGFISIRQESAASSRIPQWLNGNDYLDVDGGSPRKPDSLYMEALKG